MWDMSRIVMIVFLSLHSEEFVKFGAYKLLVTHLSCGLSCYSGAMPMYSDVFCRHQRIITCWHVTQLNRL